MDDHTYRFEYMAAHFRRDTGLLAPGKDSPPGRYTEAQERSRGSHWEEWLRSERGVAAGKKLNPPWGMGGA